MNKRRLKKFRTKGLRKLRDCLMCKHQGCKANEEPTSSRTAYSWNGKGRDPNRDIVLCESCAVDHYLYWDDMWSEYYSGRL